MYKVHYTLYSIYTMLHFTEDSKTPNFVQFYIAVRDNKRVNVMASLYLILDAVYWPHIPTYNILR